MNNTMKIAISLPLQDYYKMEKLRKKLRIQRSAFIDKALLFWLAYWERKELVKRYETGYLAQPESSKEIEALEKASAAAFKEEGLK
jgi:metal-responsive CopG/Arc/MetJ family transcriptional regulator